MTETVIACHNVLVFKSVYGRLRINRNSALGNELVEMAKEFYLDSDSLYIYLGNENNFMGHRTSAIVNMCIYVTWEGAQMYVSVVDLYAAELYKQYGGKSSKSVKDDSSSRFRSLYGSRSIRDEGAVHSGPTETLHYNASLPNVSSAPTVAVVAKRSKKRALLANISSSTTV